MIVDAVETEPAPAGLSGVAPWQAEPYRLWSLLDMLRFYAAPFFHAATFLEHANTVLLGMAEDGEKVQKAALQAVHMNRMLRGLPVSATLRNMAERLTQTKDTTPDVLIHLIGEFQVNLDKELARHVFLCLPEGDTALFEEPERWFGEAALARYGTDAGTDMRDCARCLVLEQWTASVFHAMRIAEHGLRDMARRVGITGLGKPLQDAQWQEVIEKIEQRIRQKQNPQGRKLTAKAKDRVRRLSDVASHFFYIKVAWRNHVNHSKRTYDEADARRIVENVRGFMSAMATRF